MKVSNQQLCTEKASRELMRQQNVHLIIDNLINWEKSCSEGCYQVVKAAENCLEVIFLAICYTFLH